MLQPVTPPPTITTCARLGTVPLVVPGSIATVCLPGPPDQDIRARRRPGGPGPDGPGREEITARARARLAACQGAAVRDRLRPAGGAEARTGAGSRRRLRR